MNSTCMANNLNIQTAFHFTNEIMNYASFVARPLTKVTLQNSVKKSVF